MPAKVGPSGGKGDGKKKPKADKSGDARKSDASRKSKGCVSRGAMGRARALAPPHPARPGGRPGARASAPPIQKLKLSVSLVP